MQFQLVEPAAAPKEDASQGFEAGGIFKLKEEPAGALVIPLPEALRNRNNRLQEQQAPAPPEPSRFKPPPAAYVPGLQFVGKAAARGGRLEPVSAVEAYELPMLLLNQLPGLAEIKDEKEKFKKDMDSRPMELEPEAYESMPVEEFGKALLRGMGWKEGEGIGKTNKVDAKVIQYVPRPERLGLGAQPKQNAELPESGKRRKIAKPGEQPNAKNVSYEQNVTADGKVKHYVDVDQGLVAKAQLEYRTGALVGIVEGVHEGMMGKLTKQTLERDRIVVKLGSGEEVTVKTKQTVLLDPVLLHRANGMDEVRRIMNSGRNALRAGGGGEEKKKEKRKDKKDKKSRKLNCWLVPGIVVRCVSKSLQGGKLYQKKLIVTDMTTPDTASAVLLDNRTVLIENISQVAKYLCFSSLFKVIIYQDLVETALPQTGGCVKIVRGSRRGELATLQERNSEKNRAIVQLEESGEIHALAMDDVAQWMNE
jgi:G patch domain/KOW motif-containing protein